eukprot:g2993.t1
MRVVLHLDADCFYAQVERRRLGLDERTPLVVMSWAGATAVSYPARAAGVERFDSAAAVRRRCPAARLVYMETLEEGTVPHAPGAEPVRTQRDARMSKLCLQRYRHAADTVFRAVAAWATRAGATAGVRPPVLERASIDECYLDVTALAVAAAAGAGAGAGAAGNEGTGDEASEGEGEQEEDEEDERRLLRAGAELCATLRGAVRGETGYVLSGGVAVNKAAAKLASARNKPDGQAVLGRRTGRAALLARPLRATPGCGGRLGAAVEAFVRRVGGGSAGSGGGNGGGEPVSLGCLAALLLGGGGARAGATRAALVRQLCRPKEAGGAGARPHVGGASGLGLGLGLGEASACRRVEGLARLCMGRDDRPVAGVGGGAGAGAGTAAAAGSLASRSLCCSRSFCGLSDRAAAVRWLRLLVAELRDDRLAGDAARWHRRPATLVLTLRQA